MHTRLSLGVAALVLAATFAIATYALQLVKSSMQASIAAEQMARVSGISDAIDQKLGSRRILLKTFAESVESQAFDNAEPLQAFLEKHASLRQAFDNVAFLGADGTLVANLSGAQSNGSVNIRDRDYFQQTVATKAGLVSQPYRNRLNGLAQVAITQPVLDGAGQVKFVISGAINLKDRNILGALGDIKFGKNGYLFIVTSAGVMVDHPDTARILSVTQANGGNPAILRAMAGFEGTGEGVDDAGVPSLYAFDRTEQTPWIVGAMYPRAEAFARIDAIEHNAWLGALALSLSAGALALVVVRRRLKPLAELHSHMQSARETPAETQFPRPASYTRDEIGDLSRTFDDLMAQRRASELSLARSEAQVRTIADNIPAMVSHVDASLRYTFVNERIRALHQHAPLVGRLMPEVRGADFAVVEPYFLRALAGETVILEKIGDPGLGIGNRTFQAHYIPDLDAAGAVRGVFAMTFDITDEVNARKAVADQGKRLRDVTDSIPALVGYFDRNQVCLYGNIRARQMAGLGDAPIEGATLGTVLGEAIYEQHKPYLPVMLSGKKVRFPVRAPVHGKQGYFQVNLIPDTNPRGEVVGFYLMSFNITALKEAELRQAESELRLRTITDNLPVLITYIDRDEKITFANATSREWLGLDPMQVVGRHLQDVAGREVYLSRRPMLARALAGERVEFEARTQRTGFERITQVIYVPDIRADGLTHGIFSLALDITALKLVEHQLIELARLDTLTSLPNRLAFNEHLPDAVLRVRLTGNAMALMFLDIDHFKTINDTFGHALGDAVLVEYARRLLASVRGTDKVARLAGDEFVLVIENLSGPQAAATVAEKIVQRIGEQPFVVEGQTISVTTSIGIAFHWAADSSATAEELLARADAALYNAKAAGRNRFEFFLSAGVPKDPLKLGGAVADPAPEDQN
ncbi:diguanylate cyclase domain-containing protein [Variovorax sp. GB4P3]